MKTIHKFQVKDFSQHEVVIPFAGRVVHVSMQQDGAMLAQRNVVTFWVELNTGEATILRYFQLFGTGHDIPTNAIYCGTVHDHGMVWHLYEVQP